MFVNLEHRFVRSIRSIEQYVIRFDELASDRHVDAHTQDVAIVHRTWVWVLDFVGCHASTGAVDVLKIPIRLSLYEFCGVATTALIRDGALF